MTAELCPICKAGPLHATESDDLGRCASCAAVPLTAETITDAMISELDRTRGDEWVEVENMPRMRLEWWAFDALHSQSDHHRQRGRRICADIINAKGSDDGTH